MKPAIVEPAEWRELIRGLGRQVFAARGALGWSQQELAARSHTSQGLISRMEHGHCIALPLLSVLKVFHALRDALPALGGAAAPTARALAAATLELVAQPPAAPIDPGLAALLRAYGTLSPGQRATFRRLAIPLAAVVAELPARAIEPQLTRLEEDERP